ncbi:MAG: tetratricopeptide repeat protein [Candidatus Omnitrophota bacterium]
MKNKRVPVELIILLVIFIFSLPLLKSRIAIVLNNQGTQYWEKGEPEKAIDFFQYSLRIVPKADVCCNLALAYKEIGRTSEAVAAYMRSLRLLPAYVRAYYGLADIYLGKQMYEDAISCLHQARVYGREEAEINLKNVNLTYAISLFNEAADYYYIKKDTQEALLRLNRSIILEPDFALSYKMRGDIEFKGNLFAEAIEDYKIALDLGLKKVKIYNLYNDIGISYLRLEDNRNAVEYLNKAYLYEPENTNVLYTLACALRDDQKWTEALKRYHELMGIKMDYPNVHNDVAGIYHLLDDEENAIEEYQKEIETAQGCLLQNQDDARCLLRLAGAYNGLGRYAEAKGFADRAIQLDSGYADAFYIRASINENLGRMEEAVNDLSRAKELYPRTKFVDNYILRLKTQRGRPAQASYFLPDTVVHLKNGRKIEGRLQIEDEKRVFLEVLVGVSYGTIGIERDSIMSLQRQ